MAPSSGAKRSWSGKAINSKLRGIAQEPVHKYSPFDKDRNLRPVVGVYVVVKHRYRDYLYRVHEHRGKFMRFATRSSAWKAWLATRKVSMVTGRGRDDKEDGRKTCCKYTAPRPPRQNLFIISNTDGGEGMAPEKDIIPSHRLIDPLRSDRSIIRMILIRS